MTQDLALFSFGTLMDAELLELVCQQSMETLVLEPAKVIDHARRWVIDDHYPVLLPEKGRDTQGLIIRGLNDESLERIVFFEGEEFTVQLIDVLRENDQSETVKHFADNHRKVISDSDWSMEQWQRTTKPDTMPRVHRYMQCYGRMSAAEADAYW